MPRKRLEYIDVCKGIGILLVVLGHTLVSGIANVGHFLVGGHVYEWNYSFHMPLSFSCQDMSCSCRKILICEESFARGAKICLFRTFYLRFSFFPAGYLLWRGECIQARSRRKLEDLSSASSTAYSQTAFEI